MIPKLYQSIGLPLDTWRAVDTAKSSPILQEALASKYPTTSETLALLIRYGMARLEQLEDKFHPEVLA